MTQTSFKEIDIAIESLEAHKQEWARLAIPRKIEMMLDVRKNIGIFAEDWVNLSVEAKELADGSPLAGEEWVTGPWVLAATINNYMETLHAINNNSKKKLLKKVSINKSGQAVVQVFPSNIFEKLLLNGIHADVWMQPGVTKDNLTNSIGTFYDKKNPEGNVSLVLGAGNINSIAPLDVLHKLLYSGDVVILKMNPVNEYLGPVLEKIFDGFIQKGYLKLVYGSGEVGEYLTVHPKIKSIHITGS